MIDFRYHLVSLISVFLALAVGIVLGAGPLQESIGATLQSQVEALRTDRDNLRTEVDQARGTIQQLDEYVVASAPGLLADTLTATDVAVVTAPGTDSDTITAVTDRLDEAGATVTARVTLAEAALNPETGQDLLSTLRAIDPALPEDDAAALTTALAKALTAGSGQAGTAGDGAAAGTGANGTGTDAAGAGPASEPTAEPTEESPGEASDGAGGQPYDADEAAQVLTAFSDAGRITGGELAPGETAVFVGPPAPDATDSATAQATPASEQASSAAANLATALAAWAPTVVAGTTASAATGLLSTLRSDDAAITTVDGLELSAGPVLTALALDEAIAGNPGAFGFADNAQSIVPGAEG